MREASGSSRQRVGNSPFTFTVGDDWPVRPDGFTWREVAGVAVDSHGRVYLFNRGDHPVMIFNPDGAFLRSWGEGVFVRPHGITIGPDDTIYCTDDLGHTVRIFSPEGELLRTLGTGHPSATGATSLDFRTIRQAGPPFHYPTNVALSPEGELYITDGYGNARVHKFSMDGQLLFSWGEPGIGPGQFQIPHGIAVDHNGVVLVADRENSRIQFFAPTGEFLREWTNIARPCQVAVDGNNTVYVAELGYRAGMWPGISPPLGEVTGGRVSIFDAEQNLLARWGGGERPAAPGDFFAPHDICVDSQGNLYVAEVVWSAGANRGIVPQDCHAIQKFTRC